MAKKSVRNRNAKRAKLINRFRAKREQLRSDRCDVNLTEQERLTASRELCSMPRDTSSIRRRNRCKICGRPRAYNRLTGLCRLHMRIAVVTGMVPGLRKASW
ncbi:MAG: 30S ribosomal protein S14 [uncultured bacterium]|nr:MAG: 30S ribosomal protein S14 [uncultured bacterium]OGT58584.1 MAG: hypothetical protein A3F43_01425 [Gammaproteobacteria bacterium RIFCSPHIGHO2_12_FULL_42_10]